MITESQNNAMANAVGAGRTDMIFACVDQVTEEDTSDCYSEAFAELSTEHDEFVLDKGCRYGRATQEGFPFVVLASELRPQKQRLQHSKMWVVFGSRALVTAGQTYRRNTERLTLPHLMRYWLHLPN